MTTNSRTWFYNEPEHRPYYLEERVNQNLWASRFGSIYLDCVRAEPPFRMEGVWNGITVSIEWVPKDWFTRAKLCSERHDAKMNFFGVNASQSLSEWRRRRWIYHEDPRGWFQWYCRYYLGRRCPDDERQIRRWKAIRRHAAQIRKHCEPGDLKCRPRQRQALLNWAYDSRTL